MGLRNVKLNRLEALAEVRRRGARQAVIVGARSRVEADERHSEELAGASATDRLPVSRPR